MEEITTLGYKNGVRFILRYSHGSVLCAALGQIRGMDEMQAIIWDAQEATIKAWKWDFHALHMETVNRAVYDALNLQEYAFPPPNLEGPIC